MTYELLISGTHGNYVSLYKKKTSEGVFYIKEACDEASNAIIEKEYQGYTWYYENVLKRKSPVVIFKGRFYEVMVPEYLGRTFSPYSKIKIHKDAVFKVIDFYKKKWPPNKIFAIHGDMGLNNIIVDENSGDLMFIDWEHFHYSDLSAYGVDIISMLFILIQNELLDVGFIDKETKEILRECYTFLLNDISFPCKIIEGPFYHTKRYMLQNSEQYSPIDLDIKMKFPLAGFCSEKLFELDQFIFS
jgi:hypothetical protein